MGHYLSAEEIAEQLRREGDANVSSRTVHYYAEQRLLPPPEYDGSRPRYTEIHLRAMRKARALKRAGRTLEQVAEMVAPAAPAQPLSDRSSTARQVSAASRRAEARTIVVGPGLTLSAVGWTDDELALIVRAIHTEVEALGRA